MPSFLPAPSYQDFSLQLAQGHWLPTSRWNAEDFQYFIEAKQHKLSQLLLPPKLYRHKRRVSSSLESNWILQGIEQQKPMGWAELQSFPGPNYRRGLLFFAIEPEAAIDAMDLLTGLVSLAFTIGRFDQIMLLSLTEDSSVLDKLEQIIGSQGKLYTFPLKPWIPSNNKLQAKVYLVVDRSSWRASPELQPSQRYLKHIEMRLQRMNKMDQSLGKPKRKRNFLARLFKPTIDDSIF